MKRSDFDYFLPKSLIAQFPLPRRDSSRLLVLHRKESRIEHRTFLEFPDFLSPGDALVLNNTKVTRARLFGSKETGGKVEALFLRPLSPLEYEVLLNPSDRLKEGSLLFFDHRPARLVGGEGTVKRIRFEKDGIGSWLKGKGSVPLPPYIRRPPQKKDLFRYQTVYAKKEGAVAAPTAGLHFTKTLLRRLKEKGVSLCQVTLHVGYGTFEPVRCEALQDHRMHEEYFEISPRSASLLNAVRRRGGKIVSVGTTSCRVLETVISKETTGCDSTHRLFRPMKGWTDLFIYPPYTFRGTDALFTNFHLPQSTLFMLVSAFGGMSLLRQAYEEAIRQKYRFYSYGDAMLIL